jgi:hypothetical protein
LAISATTSAERSRQNGQCRIPNVSHQRRTARLCRFGSAKLPVYDHVDAGVAHGFVDDFDLPG